MDEAKWVRLAAAAGLIFVVLIIVQGPVLQSSSPSTTDSAAKAFNFFKNHQSDIKASSFLLGLAMSAVLIWASVHFRALRKAEGGHAGLAVAALGGVVLATAMSVTSAATNAAAALRINDLGQSGAHFYFVLTSFLSAGILFGLAVLVGATSVVVFRTGVFHRWSGYLSLILAIGSFIGATGVAYANDFSYSFMGAMLSLDSLWIGMVAVFLLRNPDKAIL
jgi:hypothetical protein